MSKPYNRDLDTDNTPDPIEVEAYTNGYKDGRDAGYRAALSDALDKVEAMKTNFPTVAEIFAAEIRKLGQ